MRLVLLSSILLLSLLCVLVIPQASALPVTFNTTAINLGLSSTVRNSSAFDIFPLVPDNWLWEKFDNNTSDSSPLNIAGTVTYNSNLKALWKFENTLTDSTTNGRTLTKAAGTTTYTTSAEEGSGLVLDGSTYYTASDTGLPTGTNPISVSGWIYVNSFANSPAYFEYGTGAGTVFSLLFDVGGHIDFFNGLTTPQISTSALSINTWYYVTVTYDGTNARVYINGSLDKTTAITVNTSLGGASGLSIGAFNNGNQKLNGKLDEFRVYTGTALTLQQHQALYMVGHYSQSHTFDGGEYVSVGTNSFNLLHNGSPFTISYWSKLPSGFPLGVLLDDNNGGLLGNIGFTNVVRANGEVDFQVTNGGGAGNPLSLVSNTGVYPSDGLYHYLTYDFDGTNLSFYLDNVLIKTVAKSGTFTFSSSNPTSSSVGIGAQGNGVSPMTGQLDNLKIYPYSLTSSQITSDQNLNPVSSGKQYMSWYHGVSGSPTLTNKLGPGQTTLTLNGNLGVLNSNIVSNNTNIYYSYGAAPLANVNHVDLITGTNTHDYSGADGTGGTTSRALFMGIKHIFAAATDTLNPMNLDSEKGNVTTTITGSITVSDQKILLTGSATGGIKFNQNTTAVQTVTTNQCELNFNPTNTTSSIDNLACDKSVPAMAVKYWNGFMIQKVAGYNTNTTQTFLNSIDQSQYKKLLSLPCVILGVENPCITFILTDLTNTDYLIAMTSTHIYYVNAQTANHILLNNNYGLQSYDIITQITTSSYPIQNPLLQGITLTGFNLNTTVNKAGLFTLPSGYYAKTTTIISAIRLIDPRWTNDATDIPVITSSQSLFPIFLTASNAPAFSAIKVTSSQQIINNQEAVWAVAQLDSTRSVEFDLPSGTCANIYIADISQSPSVWNFEGIICATGVNQKTIAYTNTVPFTFYQLKYGVTDSYVPANNGLQTTFRTDAGPTTYTVIIKNSTGTTAINQTFTLGANQTVDTRTFNVSSVSKPASLSVTVAGNQVYTAYLGSSLSLASVASFFHQYLSYQGFDLVSFIPVVLASAITRNTVGAGIIVVVLSIATLSWLSVTVVPEPIVYISAFIGVLSLVGYRSIYG